jgi:uncharacterized membrane protein YdjX (TVP38/TMEM64 family)
VAIIATIIPIVGSVTTVGLAPFIAPWLRDQGMAGVVLFTLAFAVLGALTFAPTYSSSAIAGWTFGFRTGFPAVVIGTMAGAMVCHAVARRLAGERVAEAFRDHPPWEIVRQAMVEAGPFKTLWLVILLRLSPVLPFGTTNVLLATTGVKLHIYLLGTLLGLMPRTGLVALAAAAAEGMDLGSRERWWLLAGGLVATGMCIIVLAAIGKRALDRATRAKP